MNPAVTTATGWVAGKLPAWGSWLLGRAAKVASGFGLLAGLVLIPVYAFYFLLEKRRIEDHWKEYLPLRDSAAKEEKDAWIKPWDDISIRTPGWKAK